MSRQKHFHESSFYLYLRVYGGSGTCSPILRNSSGVEDCCEPGKMKTLAIRLSIRLLIDTSGPTDLVVFPGSTSRCKCATRLLYRPRRMRVQKSISRKYGLPWTYGLHRGSHHWSCLWRQRWKCCSCRKGYAGIGHLLAWVIYTWQVTCLLPSSK